MSGNTTTAEVGIRDLADRPDERLTRASIVVFGPQGTEVVDLSPPNEIVVGRYHTADVCIEDPSLSRHHARFWWQDSHLLVEDLESRNGTWVAGAKTGRASLSSGDVVQFGGVRAVVAIMGTVSQARPPARVTVPGAEGLVVLNPEMRAIYEQVALAAANDAAVLILGETGTGKEHVALALHALSDRRDKPFKVINCGAVPRELAESMLFGHEKGAFTGAARRSIGMFEQADGGILFLDEVGELSASAQAGLLRAVETKKIARLGSSTEMTVDVRVIAATHCHIEDMVREGTFREDLLYRINTITFELPPLRKRRDEIEPLAALFLKRANESWGRSVKAIHPAAMEKLREYDWPGNIRQLRNVIERGVLCCRGDQMALSDLPQPILNARYPKSIRPPAPALADGTDEPILPYKEQLRLWEVDTIRQAMQRSAGNQRAAARLLRIPRSTLAYKLEAYGLAAERWDVEGDHGSP